MNATTPATASAPAPVTAAFPGRWRALGVIAAAQLLTALDATIVNIALPSAQQDLGFGDGQRQWVITAYTLTFAGLLLIGGRIADRVGRRTALLGSLGGFAVASAIAGIAPSFEVLVAGRALQGAFAAVLAPTALSSIAVMFRDQDERGRAFAVYGAVASSGAIVGLVVGGALTELVSWRWCLLVNVLFALAALVGGSRVRPRCEPNPATPLPVGSAGIATAGLASLVYAAAQAVGHAWTDTVVWAPAALGLALLAAFTLRQARSATPMLPLSLFGDRRRVVSYVAIAGGVVASFGLSLMLTYYFQAVLGWSPLRTGLAFLPLSVAVSVSGYVVSGRLARTAPARWLVTAGVALAAAGIGILSTLSLGSGYLTTVLPAMVLLGLGMGGVFTPAIQIVTSGVSPRDAGVAAAVANVAMQVGSSLGVAVLNSIAVSATRDYSGSPDPRAALVHGYATSAGWVAAALAAVAVLVVTGLAQHSTSTPGSVKVESEDIKGIEDTARESRPAMKR
jgi:EmrB/QacA subfamily drug resistance transporter